MIMTFMEMRLKMNNWNQMKSRKRNINKTDEKEINQDIQESSKIFQERDKSVIKWKQTIQNFT